MKPTRKPIFLILLTIIIIFFILTITLPITIYPEMYVLPWLVRLGQVPYRDFFDHHGFILYYLLSPLTIFGNLLSFQILYFLTALFIVALTSYRILIPRITVAKILLTFNLLLVFFYYSENVLWFEHFLTAFILLLYLTLAWKLNRKREIAAGFLIAFLSFIKIQSAVFLLPAIFLARSITVIFPFALMAALFSVILFSQNAFADFMSQYLDFNLRYARYFPKAYLNLLKLRLNLALAGLTVFLPVFTVLKKLAVLYKGEVIFLICASLFLFPKFEKPGFLPLIPFIFILGDKLTEHFNEKRERIIVNGFLLFVLLVTFSASLTLVGRSVNHMPPEKTAIDLARQIEAEIGQASFYLMSNEIGTYYFAGSPPPVSYPLVYPWIATERPAEAQIIQDLQTNRVEYIVIPKSPDPNYGNFHKLDEYVKSDYQLMISLENLNVYRKRSL